MVRQFDIYTEYSLSTSYCIHPAIHNSTSDGRTRTDAHTYNSFCHQSQRELAMGSMISVILVAFKSIMSLALL